MVRANAVQGMPRAWKGKILKNFLLTTAILFTGAIGYADSFTINNTGVGAPPSNSDPNWTVTTSSTPGSTNAFVTDNTGYPFGPWIADTGSYGWDSPQNSYTNNQTDAGGTNFYYTTTFDLTAFDPTTATLQFQYAVDNALTAVILNGNTFSGFPAGGLGALSATQTINTDFIGGVNTITFEALNFATATN